MMMSALLAKKVATDEDEVKVFYAFLQHNYPRFMENYFLWEESILQEDINFSMSKMQEHFESLFGDPKFGSAFYIADTEKDFNYIVDYIF